MHPLIAVPATLALVYRAWSRNSLTPVGIVTAGLTAVAHAIHPWSVFFVLLTVFFLAGTAVTKVKHDYKATLTTSASSGTTDSSAPHPRTATQVLANSFAASVLIVLHALLLRSNQSESCLARPFNVVSLLPFGIMSQYAAVAADTFSSELGILSPSQPRLITDLSGLLVLKPKQVPRGTNGGVTLFGIAAGAGGGAIIALLSILVTPFCKDWSFAERVQLFFGITGCGLCGTVLDSVMGGLLQASIIDTRTGKVIEGEGGVKVAYQASKHESKGDSNRRVLVGTDVLSNNGVNFLMATTMSIFPMAVLWFYI